MAARLLISNSGKKTSTSQTRNILITKEKRPRVIILNGRAISFKIVCMENCRAEPHFSPKTERVGFYYTFIDYLFEGLKRDFLLSSDSLEYKILFKWFYKIPLYHYHNNISLMYKYLCRLSDLNKSSDRKHAGRRIWTSVGTKHTRLLIISTYGILTDVGHLKSRPFDHSGIPARENSEVER